MDGIPVGYTALIRNFQLRVIPHYHSSYIVKRGQGGHVQNGQYETHFFPKAYELKEPESPYQQLEFALKYDGINLEIIKSVFEKLDVNQFESKIKEHPGSKYARILWFLYEFLIKRKLNIPDVKRLKYINILDDSKYFTSEGIKSKRHLINNNLLGNCDFCPIIRKTQMILDQINMHYDKRAIDLTKKYNSNIISRASYYLYNKETMSSFEIEHERPESGRANRFISTLQKAHQIQHLNKDELVRVQNLIVEPRFKDSNYRGNQNYIGENINFYLQRLHYISPKPEDVSSLMSGLLRLLDDRASKYYHPVILATVISFGFVFIHPFEDGNGRLHRFLIHYVLSKMKFTPPGIIFPISAVMLQGLVEYDKILESFSKPLMEIINNYKLSENGELTVTEDTKHHYQFIDYTLMVEYLFQCIKTTLHEHFEKEIELLLKYDKTKSDIKALIDMPDRLINLFIKFSIEGKGTLSNNKRKKYFNMLTDDELQDLREIYIEHFTGT